MKLVRRLLIASALAASPAVAQNAPNQRRPYIGYLCAAGGQRGTVARITAGGQNLRGARSVVLSGEGVRAKVIRFRKPRWLLNPDQRRAVARSLRRLTVKRRRPQQDGKQPPLPDHPILSHLDSLTPRELRRVAYEFLDRGRRTQLSAQIAERVEIEVTIDANADPGDRELRIRTARGLTNPVLFQVGSTPEFSEGEPNDYRTLFQPTADLPCVFNGQVSFKDIDRFRFRAQRGQRLVIEAQARRLIPYLADAVPGWFQATLALYDAKGNELRFVDDYRFDPDPVLFFDVPEDGDYVIQIRDAIYRGREDFVYRVMVSERPFVMTMFPLGARRGAAVNAAISGWNLAWKRMRLDTRGGAEHIRRATWSRNHLHTNPVFYAVDRLQECNETEPNGLRGEAQRIYLPRIVNGRIEQAGDVDRFRFTGRAAEEIVAEVYARRLGSPLDSLLRLTNEEGCVIAWNDDHADRTAGLVTHQADSYLRARLPGNGVYDLRVSDAQGHGGAAFAYRLRVSRPRPDFSVIVTPASINVPAGGHAAITVHAVRRDGFDGAIDLTLPNARRGLFLNGGRIPAGCDRIRMTLAAPPQRRGPPIPLEIVASAAIAGKTVRRAAIPAVEMMQAFGLRHLVPAQQLLVDVIWSWRRALPMRAASDRPVRILLGRTAEIRITAPGLPPLDKVRFELDAPPAGVTLREVRAEHGDLVLIVAAESGKAQAGLRDNLIVKARVEFDPPRRRGRPKPGKKKQAGKPPPKRIVLALLPALPIEVRRQAQNRTK